jgi:F0F1-type ATP synthase assembly protein I
MADRTPNRPITATGFLGIGSEMAGFTVIGVILDLIIGSMPGFTIGLTLLGVVVAFIHLVQATRAKPGPPDGGGRPR